MNWNGSGGNFGISLLDANISETLMRYWLRWSQSVASTGTTARYLSSRVEDVRTLQNKKATVSFRAYNNGGPAIQILVQLARYFGNGGARSVSSGTAVTPVVINANPGKYSVTLEVPNTWSKTIGTNGNDWFGLYIYLPNT